MQTYNNARAVVPSDTKALGFTAQAIGLDAGGTVCVDTAGGSINQTLTLGAGITRIAITKVYATGTTANITAYW